MENVRNSIRVGKLTAEVYERLSGDGIEITRHIGEQGIHEDTAFEAPCFCHAYFHSGVPFRLGAFSGIVGGIVYGLIGRYCSIAAGSVIGPGEHPTDRLSTSWISYVPEINGWRSRVHGETVPYVEPLPFTSHRPAVIGNDVWIGANVFIRGGVTVGDGAIIAAGAVVVKDVPPYMIVGGNPARSIRSRFSDSQIEALLSLRCWDYSYFDLAANVRADINETIDNVRQNIQSGVLAPYSGKKHSLLALAESLA
jgi:acetyltransferase-like isoleucine patch superfamily enzyme